MKEFALDVENLMVNYEKSLALFDISVKVPQGQLVAIVGPNGAGKSTFLKSILGLIPSLSGKVRFCGLPLKDVRHQLAYIPQKESIDWQFPLTCLDFVLMGLYGRMGLFRRVGKEEKNAAFSALEMVGLQEFAFRQIDQLSGGQKQRLFIARSYLQKANLTFMDEPFSGVDLKSQEIIMEQLRAEKMAGKTFFVVHHGLEKVRDFFDWVILINRSLIASGKVEEVFTRETIGRAFGERLTLFEEATGLAKECVTGQ